MTPATYTAGEVARLLRMGRATLLARLDALTAAGMPAPLCVLDGWGSGRRVLFGRAAIDRWLANGAAGATTDPAPDTTGADPELARRARALAETAK